MVVVYLELANLWLCFDNISIASSVCKFGFRITKRSRNRESSRENSDGADYVFRLLRPCCAFFAALAFASCRFSFVGISFKHLSCSRLVNLSSCLSDSLILLDIRWFVVSA